jgi:hypothetical protein
VLEVSKEVLDSIPMLFSWIRVESAEYPNGIRNVGLCCDGEVKKLTNCFSIWYCFHMSDL